jgi:hypothetical protein
MKRRTPKNQAIVREEVALGERLYNSRGRRSEISGVYLGDHYSHVFASHVHTKAAQPALRLVSKNIVLMTPQEHILWENHKHELRGLPEWDWVFNLWDLLNQEYYSGKYGKMSGHAKI